MANILFVAFHGLVCLVDGGKTPVDRGFKAYVLLDNDHVHKQMYGNFLAEQDFIPAPRTDFPMNLAFSSELQAGSDALNVNLNPVVHLPDFPVATKQNVVAVITLPRPQRIDYNLGGLVTPGMLVDPPPPQVIQPLSQISQIRFFEYNFNDFTKVFLSDDQGNVLWRCPPPAPAGADNIAVFHLYDEPPQTLPSQASIDAHNIREFKDSMDFLLGSGNKVQITAPAKIDPGTFTPPHSGILPAEVASLDVRNKGLTEFVRAHRTGAGAKLGGAGGSQVCGGGNAVVP